MLEAVLTCVYCGSEIIGRPYGLGGSSCLMPDGTLETAEYAFCSQRCMWQHIERTQPLVRLALEGVAG